jgi:hypothetical protein
MGVPQSKERIAADKLLIERLRALETKDQADNDYVHVDEKAVVGTPKEFKAPWTAVSASDIKHWEHELLQDPKNRPVSPFPILNISDCQQQTSTLSPKLREPSNSPHLSCYDNRRPADLQYQDSV